MFDNGEAPTRAAVRAVGGGPPVVPWEATRSKRCGSDGQELVTCVSLYSVICGVCVLRIYLTEVVNG
jgi:hypothetical protein